MFQLKDGTGSGYLTKVDNRNRVYTNSVSIREMSFISGVDEQAYAFTTSNLSITTSEYAVAWITMPTGTDHMHIEKAWLNWNGGDTNHNRVCFVRFHGAMGTPSANHQAVTPRNLRVGSSNSANLTVYEWDGVGSGMTVSTNGASMGLIHVTQGLTTVDLDGSVIVPKDGVLGLTVEGEEAGKFAMGLTLWFNAEGE
jgi:hypothetical protein